MHDRTMIENQDREEEHVSEKRGQRVLGRSGSNAVDTMMIGSASVPRPKPRKRALDFGALILSEP